MLLRTPREATAEDKFQIEGAADYGEIGFHQQHGASYLVFPRPLPKDGGGG
jgi:hypothetical protein